MVKLFVRYIRPHIIPHNYDSEDAIVFCTSHGTPLHQGEITKKINKFFLRYGYNLNVTKLRGILATHLEESVQNETITPDGKFIPGLYSILICDRV